MKKFVYVFISLFLFQFSVVYSADTVLENISCDEVTNLLLDTGAKKVIFYDKNGIETGWSLDYANFVMNSEELKGLPLSRLCEFTWKREIFTSVPNRGDAERLIYTKDGVSKYGAIRYASDYVIKEYQEKFKNVSQLSQSQKQEQITQANPANNDSSIKDWEKAKADFDKAIEIKKALTTQSGTTNTGTLNSLNPDKKYSLVNEKKAKNLLKKIALLKKQIEQLQKQLDALN